MASAPELWHWWDTLFALTMVAVIMFLLLPIVLGYLNLL